MNYGFALGERSNLLEGTLKTALDFHCRRSQMINCTTDSLLNSLLCCNVEYL